MDGALSVGVMDRDGNLKHSGEDTESGTVEVCFLPASLAPYSEMLLRRGN